MSFPIYAARAGFACLVAIVAAGETSAQNPTQQTLVLQDAFARALEEAPSLKAADQARIGAEAGVRQADRMPNPTLDIMAENFAGGDQRQSFDRAETTLALSQKLEWGGDRSARTRFATADVAVARAGGDVRRNDVLYAVEQAYLAAQKAGAELEVARDRAAVAREIVSTVERRVQAARDPLLAGARSKALLAEAEIGVEAASRVESAAKEKLASFWGGRPDFAVDLAAFQGVAARPVADPATNPELALAAAQESRAAAAMDIETARGRQDPVVSGGLRCFHETDETALVVGFALPLPIWDKNTGAVDRAAAERSRLRYEAEALRRNLEREIATSRSQMDIARAEIEAIDQRLLPSAEDALTQARQGYAAGGFSYLDVLDAQRVLVEARLQRISALYSYHSAGVALARLTGAYAGGGSAQ